MEPLLCARHWLSHVVKHGDPARVRHGWGDVKLLTQSHTVTSCGKWDLNSSFLIPFSYSNLWLRLFICIFLLSPQTCSAAKSCPTLQPHGLQHTRLPCPSLSPGVSKLMSIELVMPSNRLILCHSLLPSVFPYIKVFSSESALHIKWPKYWSFSIRPEYSELISLLQGTLKNLLQHHSSRA